MSQEEKKQTAPETEAAAEKPETPAQEAPEKEAPQAEEKHEGKHDCTMTRHPESILFIISDTSKPSVTLCIFIQTVFQIFHGKIGPQNIHKNQFGIR